MSKYISKFDIYLYKNSELYIINIPLVNFYSIWYASIGLLILIYVCIA